MILGLKGLLAYDAPFLLQNTLMQYCISCQLGNPRGGGTSLYMLYRYVLPDRVGLLRSSVLK